MKINLLLVPVMAAAALALGCGDDNNDGAQQRQACVDQSGHVVDQALCRPGHAAFYRWYAYGYRNGQDPYSYHAGHVAIVPRSGGVIISEGHPTVTSESVTRGGFGSSAVGHGAGE